MFCRNCGNALPDDARFCNNCGLELYAQQSHAQNVNQPIYNQKPKKNTLKYIIFAIVGLVLGIAIGMVIFLRSNDNSMAGGQRIEGSGFKTPQEAAKAYIDNYGKTSAEEMYKLFAIESSVDNYTLEKQTERLKAYSNTLSVKLPVYGSVSRNIAIENKKSDINYMASSDKFIFSLSPKAFSIKSVIITSPTYEGIISNIEAIAEVCHKKKIWHARSIISRWLSSEEKG